MGQMTQKRNIHIDCLSQLRTAFANNSLLNLLILLLILELSEAQKNILISYYTYNNGVLIE